MSANTKIEWADHTFNPWIGCTKVGPGCDHCYAEADFDKRRHVVTWGAGQWRKRTSEQNWMLPRRWNKQAERLGVRYRVFCASLADVFDNEVPQGWRNDLFRLISQTPHLDWLLLTKRIGNANIMIGDALLQEPRLRTAPFAAWNWPWPNVWLGATIVNQEEADRDIPKLLAVPAAKRFLSMEPLLGPVDLERPRPGPDMDQGGIDWIIVGGESGPKARPMHPDWARSLRDQCEAAGVPFMFKQWGEFSGDTETKFPARSWTMIDRSGQTLQQAGSTANMGPIMHVAKVGKKAAGRLLDGREWNRSPT